LVSAEVAVQAGDASIRGKIRHRTDRRYARLPLEWVVGDLNPVLRGWGNYFRYGNSGQKLAPRHSEWVGAFPFVTPT